MARGELTEKQRRFVEAFMGESKGNATDAARRAGYAGNDVTLESVGRENLGKPRVREAIEARVKADPAVKSRKQLQQWWSTVVDDTSIDYPHRLKASELLGKSQGAFVDRHELTGANGTPLAAVVRYPRRGTPSA